MATPRKIYERPLRRPLTQKTKRTIDEMIVQYRARVPISVKATWVKKQVLSLQSSVANFWIAFRPDKVVVFEEAGGAGSWLPFVGGEKVVIAWLEEMAERLDL